LKKALQIGNKPFEIKRSDCKKPKGLFTFTINVVPHCGMSRYSLKNGAGSDSLKEKFGSVRGQTWGESGELINNYVLKTSIPKNRRF